MWASDPLRTLLSRLLGPNDEDALGDLDEERARRRRSQSWLRVELWYVHETLSLVRAVARWRWQERERPWSLGGVRRDLRHAVRGLVRDRGSTAVIIITLTVALGAATTIFAVADAAFLRPFPYPDADRLVHVFSGSREDPGTANPLSPLDARDLRAYAAVVEALGVWTVGETVHLAVGDGAQRLEAPRASASLFRILGATPALGRFFTSDEEVPGGDDAVVLSHDLWTTTFGADSTIVGRSIRLDGRAYRVVGVTGAAALLPRDAKAWRALALGPEWYAPGRWGWQFLSSIVRLRPGVAPETASELFTARLAASVPVRVDRGQTRVARTLAEERVGTSGSGVLLLLGAVGLLLVLAAANVMNVILARSERRIQEFGVRRALGSGAAPLVRLVALETAVLAFLGGAGGLLVAQVALPVLRAADIASTAYLGTVGVDLRVIGLGLALAVLTGAACGIAPVLRVLRTDAASILKKSGLRVGSSRGATRIRNGLVIAQIGLACALLVAVGLSATAFVQLVNRDPGFRSDGVLAAVLELPGGGFTGEKGAAYYRSLVRRVEALPGVDAAGAVAFLPLGGQGWSASFDLVDPDPMVTDPDPGGNMRPVTPGYFETMGIPLLEGRLFTDADDEHAAPVVIVDETLARRYWGSSPAGRRAVVGGLSRAPATVIGVVGSVPDETLASRDHGHVYFPVYQSPQRRMVLVLHTESDPASLAPTLRGAIHETEPTVAVTEVTTLEALIGLSVAAPRSGLLLLGAFGTVAVLLAAVGIYGVLAYAVACRAGEIGTRMALGATPRMLLGSILGQAVRLWALGVLFGSAGALVVAALLTHFVPGVHPVSPIPYAAAFLGLGTVSVVAALVPAYRATSVDPARALRAE